MKGHGFIRIFIVATVLVVCCCYGAHSYATQTGTSGSPTPATQPVSPPVTPAFFKVYGNIIAPGGSKIKGVVVFLVQVVASNPAGPRQVVALPEKCTTDDAGNYAFGVSSANKGKSYKVAPKYSTFPLGTYFTPPDKTFTLNGSIKVDFTFDSPHLQISGVAKRPLGRKMPGIEIQLFEVHGPHQFKFLSNKTTDAGGAYKFELDHYGNIGKSFMMRARHPQNQIIGQGFTPTEKIIALTGNTVVDFIYDGPLPDLVVSNVQYINDRMDPEYVIFTIKNQSERNAGSCQAELGYNTYHYSTGENPYSTVTRPVPPLAPGASYDMQFWFPVFADTKNSVSRFFVDRYDEVIEKDEGNNIYPKQ